jgi:hypothetical protein
MKIPQKMNYPVAEQRVIKNTIAHAKLHRSDGEQTPNPDKPENMAVGM